MRIICTVINDLNYDQRMQRICTSLALQGFEVKLVGRILPDSVALSPQPFLQKRLKLLFVKGKLFYLEYNIRLFFYLLFQRADILCGIDLDTILPCYFVSVLRRKKIVYDAHEIFPEMPEVERRPFTKKVWLKVEKFAMKRIQNMYAASQGLCDYLELNYQKLPLLIRNMPVKSESEGEGEKEQERSMIYQGALNEGRGLEELLDAMNEINLKLMLVGEGDLSDRLRKKVLEKNLEKKVEFKGKIKPDELRKITPRSFIGLNLLENRGLNYYYSLANKFFDYVQAGIPQITMRFPEYINLNKEYEVAVLIDNLQTSTLVQAVRKLQDDSAFYQNLKLNCRKARDVWNWEQEEKKLIEFYHHLQ